MDYRHSNRNGNFHLVEGIWQKSWDEQECQLTVCVQHDLALSTQLIGSPHWGDRCSESSASRVGALLWKESKIFFLQAVFRAGFAHWCWQSGACAWRSCLIQIRNKINWEIWYGMNHPRDMKKRRRNSWEHDRRGVGKMRGRLGSIDEIYVTRRK